MKQGFQTVRILGIDFFNDHLDSALDFAHSKGGVILAPSGPGLSEIGNNPQYDEALKNADLNLIDSGYLALLWKRKTGVQVNRHSGLKFIKALIESNTFKAGHSSQLWVMPNREESESARRYLNQNGLPLAENSFYIAPRYALPAVEDHALLERLRQQKPHYIILAIAGGKQEILGYWLRQHLDYRPSIICIGAAIAFLSGHQANIPAWADRIYVGWLLRILKNPKTFIPRYWKARKLRRLLMDFNERPEPPIVE